MTDSGSGDDRPASSGIPLLRADCGRCFGLCCVVPAFSAGAEFGIDKPAETPCPNLGSDFRCGIHTHLRQTGFAGCTVYDCFGAGQQVAQVTFAGRDWRRHLQGAPRMFAAFRVMRALHELLWYLTQARALPAARPVHAELNAALARTEALGRLGPDELLALDVTAHRHQVNVVLSQASELARAGVAHRADRRGADLVGKDLRSADLRGASLRGACLLGADLSGVDLSLADLTGADLRGARLAGARLAEALFVSQPQVNAATGDASTELPSELSRPAHWAA